MKNSEIKDFFANLVITPPTEEEVLAGKKRFLQQNREASFGYWYPILQKTGVKTPKTRYVEFPTDLAFEIIGEEEPYAVTGIDYLSLVKECADDIGYPCFIRGSHTSAKHYWKNTCYLEKPEDLRHHIKEIANFSAFVDIPCEGFAVRELIPTTPLFTAFSGDMPITREFRFFAENGAVTWIQPYWVPSSIQDASDTQWLAKLEKAQTLDPKTLFYLMEQTIEVSKRFYGFWSIDWLQSSTGEWYCTDMAPGNRSFTWGGMYGENVW